MQLFFLKSIFFGLCRMYSKIAPFNTPPAPETHTPFPVRTFNILFRKVLATDTHKFGTTVFSKQIVFWASLTILKVKWNKYWAINNKTCSTIASIICGRCFYQLKRLFKNREIVSQIADHNMSEVFEVTSSTSLQPQWKNLFVCVLVWANVGGERYMFGDEEGLSFTRNYSYFNSLPLLVLHQFAILLCLL